MEWQSMMANPAVADLPSDINDVPMSRTHQYRKVMKPLLERKRRARINKCLDELKDLMVYALQSEGKQSLKLQVGSGDSCFFSIFRRIHHQAGKGRRSGVDREAPAEAQEAKDAPRLPRHGIS